MLRCTKVSLQVNASQNEAEAGRTSRSFWATSAPAGTPTAGAQHHVQVARWRISTEETTQIPILLNMFFPAAYPASPDPCPWPTDTGIPAEQRGTHTWLPAGFAPSLLRSSVFRNHLQGKEIQHRVKFNLLISLVYWRNYKS